MTAVDHAKIHSPESGKLGGAAGKGKKRIYTYDKRGRVLSWRLADVKTKEDRDRKAYEMRKRSRNKAPRKTFKNTTPGAKLLLKQVEEIRRLYAKGDIRQIDLAREFGVRDSTVSRIITRKMWK